MSEQRDQLAIRLASVDGQPHTVVNKPGDWRVYVRTLRTEDYTMSQRSRTGRTIGLVALVAGLIPVALWLVPQGFSEVADLRTSASGVEAVAWSLGGVLIVAGLAILAAAGLMWVLSRIRRPLDVIGPRRIADATLNPQVRAAIERSQRIFDRLTAAGLPPRIERRARQAFGRAVYAVVICEDIAADEPDSTDPLRTANEQTVHQALTFYSRELSMLETRAPSPGNDQNPAK